MEVLKVFNNNVVLARDDGGGEVVLTGRGLGFQARPGQAVDQARVQRTFVPDADHAVDQLAAFLTYLPPEHLAVAGEILDRARTVLGITLTQGLVIPLADHLSFAIKRVRQGMSLEYPLRAEVAHLYPRELAFAREALTHVAERTGVTLPEDEAIPIALHFVNAAFATDDLSRTFQMTEVFAQVFGVLESAYGRRFDESSMNAARFVTHLRYFFVRVDSGRQLDERQDVLATAIRISYPEAYACAAKVRALLELRLGAPVTEDELTYLTLHVARLATEAEDTGARTAAPEA